MNHKIQIGPKENTLQKPENFNVSESKISKNKSSLRV